MNVVVIGLGGIGTWLTDSLSKYLQYDTTGGVNLKLVDGDSFEEKNQQRQSFLYDGLHVNKAKAKAVEVSRLYPNINVTVIEEYINEVNVDQIFPADFVFICVDQHASRKIIGEAILQQKPGNITVISGGNELNYGNVLVHIRRNGQDITPPITEYEEIKNANMSEHPDRLSCAELAESDPQVIFVNMQVAISMCNVFYAIMAGKNIGYPRVDVDIVQNGVKPYLQKEIADAYMKIS